MKLFIDAIKASPRDKGSGGNKHVLAAKINGFWSVAEKDAGDYVGRHRRPAHSLLIGGHAKGQKWMGCQTCLGDLTDGMVIDRPVQKRHRRDRYWAEPQV